jgi:cytochrome c-type biogenesis protein CcsB
MDPIRVTIDTTLLVIGIAAYVTAALVMLGFFLLRRPILRNLGLPLAAIGCAAQFAELGTRWWMSGVWPLTNLYGSLSLFSAFAVLIFLVFAYKYDLAIVGGFLLPCAAIALGYATVWNEGTMPAVPALQSYWIKIHVPIVVASYATFLFGFCVSALYLLKDYAEKHFRGRSTAVRGLAATPGAPVIDVSLKAADYNAGVGSMRQDTPAIAQAAAAGDPWAVWLAGLPSLARLDVMQYRIIGIGLPLLSIGVITGAMWAKEAWGAYWQWDPKETAALASWIIYAIYLHLHTRPEWKGTRTAWISVLGFASIMFCYLGVNIWISGLHSYKM